jgi:hypothetical protein
MKMCALVFFYSSAAFKYRDGINNHLLIQTQSDKKKRNCMRI